MATYPEIDKEQAGKAIQALLFQMLFETFEQKRDRIERKKVYELKRLNDNLENQRNFTRPSCYNTWKSKPVKKWKPDRTPLYIVGFEILVLAAAIVAVLIYYFGWYWQL